MKNNEKTVTETYKEIFSNDPLLLKEESRDEYGRALLKHLLLHRTISACEPEPIDLHSPESRNQFRKRPAPTTSEPPQDLTDRYRRSRLDRSLLTEGDLIALRKFTLTFDATYTSERTDLNKFASHHEAVADLKEKNVSSQIEKRLRIAVVGHRVGISKLANKGYFGEQLCALETRPQFKVANESRGVLNLGRTKLLGSSADWEDAILNCVRRALLRTPHIVLLPEFALPSQVSGEATPIESRIRELSVAAPHDHFVFAGSRHEGGGNRGLVLSRQQGAVCEPWWHYKSAPARGLGENILGPDGVKLPIYMNEIDLDGKRFPIAVIVAICYDAFDPSMFLNLVLQCRQASKEFMSVILVPSFNTSPEFVELLRDLSCVARCAVVYVNGLHGDAKAFVFGFDILDMNGKEQSLLDSVEARSKAVTEEIETLNRDLSALMKDRKIEEANEVRARVSRLAKEEVALTLFEPAMKSCGGAGAFKHMLTVERESIVNGQEGDHALCRTDDIIYYNLDGKLLYALKRFRETFFDNDSFLPEPFATDSIERTVAQMRQRAMGRAAKL